MPGNDFDFIGQDVPAPPSAPDPIVAELRTVRGLLERSLNLVRLIAAMAVAQLGLVAVAALAGCIEAGGVAGWVLFSSVVFAVAVITIATTLIVRRVE